MGEFCCDHRVLNPSNRYINPLETTSAENSDFSRVQPSKCCGKHTVLPEAINGPQRARSILQPYRSLHLPFPPQLLLVCPCRPKQGAFSCRGTQAARQVIFPCTLSRSGAAFPFSHVYGPDPKSAVKGQDRPACRPAPYSTLRANSDGQTA